MYTISLCSQLYHVLIQKKKKKIRKKKIMIMTWKANKTKKTHVAIM